MLEFLHNRSRQEWNYYVTLFNRIHAKLLREREEHANGL